MNSIYIALKDTQSNKCCYSESASTHNANVKCFVTGWIDPRGIQTTERPRKLSLRTLKPCNTLLQNLNTLSKLINALRSLLSRDTARDIGGCPILCGSWSTCISRWGIRITSSLHAFLTSHRERVIRWSIKGIVLLHLNKIWPSTQLLIRILPCFSSS